MTAAYHHAATHQNSSQKENMVKHSQKFGSLMGHNL